MGTRNLTKVIDSTGRTRVAQYGQWDGYPEYTGTRILEFIKEHKMLNKIENALRKVHFINDVEAEEFSKPYTTDGWMNMDQADTFSTIYPNLTRDTGCDILKVLVYSVGYTIPLVDTSDFESDDLMCEGVYTLNFQTRTFISTYNGVSVSIGFDQLPTAEEYLNSFKKLLTNA
jgi:hypothetical protein